MSTLIFAARLSPRFRSVRRNAAEQAAWTNLLHLGLMAGLLFVASSVTVSAQNDWRVFFVDKGPAGGDPGEFRPGSELYEAARAQLSDRCLQRRARNLENQPLISLEDAPLYPPYLEQVEAAGAQIQLELRWRNYAVVSCDSSVALSLLGLDVVKTVQACANLTTTLTCTVPDSRISIGESACGTLDYGASWSQVASVNVPPLHELGVMGRGVRIGVIDSGFRWRDTPALQHLTVIAERDFIYLDDVTQDEPGELVGQEGHGTLVLSALAGLDESELIGIAPLAEFLLAKTEDLRYERHREEDNFAAAVEWIEAKGAEILTASVGYLEFDEGQEAYPPDILDGSSSICTQALNGAAARGLLCVISAGNTGPSEASLLLPADAPDAIAVAAVSPDGEIEPFSARGPVNSILKPNVAAQGSAVIAAHPGPGVGYASIGGTSMAAPLICGGLALLLELNPQSSAQEIRETLYANASQSTQPDSAIGYGIANFTRSARDLSPLVASEPLWYPLGAVQRVVLAAEDADAVATLFLRLPTGVIREFQMQFAADMFYFADVPRALFPAGPNASLEAYIEIKVRGWLLRRPAAKGNLQTTNFRLCADGTYIPCGIAPNLLPRDFPSATSEGIFPTVASRSQMRILLIDSAQPQDWRLQLFALDGRRLQSGNEQGRFSKGFNVIPLRTRKLSSGMYMLKLQLRDHAKYFSFFVVE